VQACVEGGDGDRRVHPVGRGDDDGVEVFLVQHFLVVFIGGDVVLQCAKPVAVECELVGPDVADGLEADVFGFVEFGAEYGVHGKALALFAEADEADVEGVGFGVVLCEHGRRPGEGGTGRGSGSEECSAVHAAGWVGLAACGHDRPLSKVLAFVC
jgi:hypothetical protein